VSISVRRCESHRSGADDLSACVGCIAAGDAEALAHLYDRTSRLVYSLALRILRRPDEAEEVVIDVYAQVWRSATTFEFRRGPVEAWLATIARSRALDRRRARNARPDFESLHVAPLENAWPEHEREEPTNAWDARRLAAGALQALAPAERRLVELAFFDGYTHRELSALLGLPLGTVKTRIRNSLHRMRSALSSDERVISPCVLHEARRPGPLSHGRLRGDLEGPAATPDMHGRTMISAMKPA